MCLVFRDFESQLLKNFGVLEHKLQEIIVISDILCLLVLTLLHSLLDQDASILQFQVMNLCLIKKIKPVLLPGLYGLLSQRTHIGIRYSEISIAAL